MIQATCERHRDRPAVGRFAIVHLFSGGKSAYCCAECANGRIPHDPDAARWVLKDPAHPWQAEARELLPGGKL